MKFLITCLYCYCCLLPLCYSQENYLRPGTVNIHGSIVNNTSPFVELAISGYFNSRSESIPVGKDGTFNMDVQLEGLQDIYFYLDNSVITIFAQHGDTIQLSWDASRTEQTLTITSPNPGRSRDWQLCLDMFKKHRQPFINLQHKLAKEKNAADSLKFSWINDSYNQEINTALADTNHLPPSIHKILNDIYYSYASELHDNRLANSYQLTTQFPVHNLQKLKAVEPAIKGVFPTGKILNKEIFWISHVYRSYLYTYIMSKVQSVYDNFTHILYLDPTYKTHFTPLWNEYYTCMANMSSYPVRDWMITQSIMRGFQHYTFEEAEAVLHDFLGKCTVKAYSDTLTKFYNNAKRLKTGNHAPDFTLMDSSNKRVSLHDLKGKIVYIDFWGLACAPCIRDIKNYVPELHKRYHGKDVVFVNVCVTGGKTEPKWIQTVNDLHLNGINLIAPGWPLNQICTAYNVGSIPHYVLIDQEGRIVAANAADPGTLTRQKTNDIDRLLTK